MTVTKGGEEKKHYSSTVLHSRRNKNLQIIIQKNKNLSLLLVLPKVNFGLPQSFLRCVFSFHQETFPFLRFMSSHLNQHGWSLFRKRNAREVDGALLLYNSLRFCSFLVSFVLVLHYCLYLFISSFGLLKAIYLSSWISLSHVIIKSH